MVRGYHHHEHCAATMWEGTPGHNTTHVCVKDPLHRSPHECSCGAEWAYPAIQKLPSKPIIRFDPGCA